MLTDQLADMLNMPDQMSGFIVKTVATGSPADETGLRGATTVVPIAGHDVPLGGDIVMAVEGIPMSAANLPRVREALGRLSSGNQFSVTILRPATSSS